MVNCKKLRLGEAKGKIFVIQTIQTFQGYLNRSKYTCVCDSYSGPS